MGASLANIGPRVAQTAGEQLEGAEAVLDIGSGVLRAAVEAGAGFEALIDTQEDGPTGEYLSAAQTLARIASKATGALDYLVEAGLVDSDQLEALLAQEGDRETGDGQRTAGNDGGSDPAETDPEVAAVRDRQETILKEIFGNDMLIHIASLSQNEMEEVGKLVEALYLRTEVAPRAVPTQEDRARQFAEYISGEDPEDIASKYGITKGGLKVNLRKAIEIMQRKNGKVYLQERLTQAIEQLRAQQ